MTLFEQINAANLEVAYARQALSKAQQEVDRLMNARVDCVHDFVAPHPAYVHEGGQCKLCGINEIYASTLKRKA